MSEDKDPSLSSQSWVEFKTLKNKLNFRWRNPSSPSQLQSSDDPPASIRHLARTADSETSHCPRSSLAMAALRAALSLTKEVADVFPPLKAAVGGVLSVIKVRLYD